MIHQYFYTFLILACTCFARPTNNSHSKSSSGDPFISVGPAISHYHDDTASSNLIGRQSLTETTTIHSKLVSPSQQSETITSNQSKVKIMASSFSHEHRARLVAAWTQERKQRQSQIARLQKLGSIHSDATKSKMRKAATGKEVNKLTRERLRKSQLGKRKSVATKLKISQTLKRTKLAQKEALQGSKQSQPKEP